MTSITNLIPIAQVVVSVLVIILILLQERDSGAGSLFGGGGGGGFYQRRRGLERTLFVATIIGIIVFAGLALVNLFIR